MGAPHADDPFTVTRDLETEVGPDQLWDAVIDDEQRAAWWGGETALDPTPGGTGYATDPDGAVRIVEVDEVHDDGEGTRRLALRWWPAGGGPTSTVELVVEPRPGGSRLTITERPTMPTATLCASRVLDLELVLLLAAHQRCVGTVSA